MDAKIMREHHRLTKEMYHQIIKKISQVAKANAIDLVIYRPLGEIKSQSTQQLIQEISQRRVLYVNPKADLTQVVLGGLNEDYLRSK